MNDILEETQETLDRVYKSLDPIYEECKNNPDIFFEMVFTFAFEYGFEHYRSLSNIINIQHIAQKYAVHDYENNKGLKFLEE